MIHQTADAITMFRLIEHNMESLEFDEAIRHNHHYGKG
jgi:hypothetical protein